MKTYLRSVVLEVKTAPKTEFPFTLPLFQKDWQLELSTPITFILGDNGTGKSTFLENLAYNIGFNILGGSEDHFYKNEEVFDSALLSNYIKLTWNEKIKKGFFFRAENFLNFSSYIDEVAKEKPSTYLGYGGKSLQKVSHGESFLELFKNKFRKTGIFLLDEPEAALSPERQLSLISILNTASKNGCQFIISTHSPLLIAVPNAKIYEIEDGELVEKSFEDTKQFFLYKTFINNPERYLKYLCNED